MGVNLHDCDHRSGVVRHLDLEVRHDAVLEDHPDVGHHLDLEVHRDADRRPGREDHRDEVDAVPGRLQQDAGGRQNHHRRRGDALAGHHDDLRQSRRYGAGRGLHALHSD